MSGSDDLWPLVTLGDLLRIKHGFAFKGDHFSDKPGAVVLTPGNFEAKGGLKLRPEKDRSYTADFPPEFVLQTGDLLVVMTDLTQEANILGAPALVPDDFPCLHNQRLGRVMDVAEDRLDRRFLYYVFNSSEYRERLKSTATGSTVRHTSPKRIYEHHFRLPPLETQRRIVSILGAYDDLIEVNRRRVAVLEEMARGLFEEWFVSFRFPGHETVPILDTPDGPLPEGWNNGVLGDMVQLEYGKALKADTRMPGPFPVFGSGGKVGQHNQALIKGPGIILGRKGNVGAVIWSKNDFWPIDTVYYVVSRYPLTYLYHLLHLLPFQNTDAAVPGLNRGGALKIPVAAPPSIICEEYDRLVRSIFALRDKLLDVIDALAASRDLLLPRLISGQLSVASAERELEKVA
jgi:type I restriction enzyme S subunit